MIDAELVQWTRSAVDRSGTPLLVAMHGVGSNEQDLLGLAPALPPAWTVASLRAPMPWGPGFSWYPLGTPGSPDPEAVDAAVAEVLDWVDSVAADHPRIGLLGFSQGGSMALQLLRARPAAFAFAVSLSGFVVPGVTDSRDEAVSAVRPRVFLGHGDLDPVIPADATARTQAWAAAHTDVTDRSYAGLPHAVSTAELADVAAFIDAG
ncbi:alpha/beta hydrolase [Curtobacterium aurantiacum]|uniref:Dienelactone hydrolase family protein n=1 Tax=Curtobacterium aurantiacum TaxID=3236919 RepID=A0ABS5VA62_9MICO|nr:alpha/beta hydrolase-fold protein [Curtobacterium flaccumfaciens]MBT1543993.1 dienelactone hydrolase family protein [Curtobacterium flaccumfaciens pv. flaccumfaciens]MBT1586360.1 dienelactone hydrolase family protein [Curtobacterium flaccumfaciens pv. flaccumfaciens]MBT1679159.1 dienelactone hydrolase family protein [Curtobacterium flaccumfaciens pv. flaccumfaciens]